MRRVALLLTVGVVSVTVIVGGGTWWALRATVRAFEPSRWSDDAVPIEEARRVFGVKFAARPARWRSRQVNVQDATFEALAELGDEDAAQRFLELNHFAVALDAEADVDAQEEELGRAVQQRRVLHAPEDERFDRAVVLLSAEGRTWVALSARER